MVIKFRSNTLEMIKEIKRMQAKVYSGDEDFDYDKEIKEALREIECLEKLIDNKEDTYIEEVDPDFLNFVAAMPDIPVMSVENMDSDELIESSEYEDYANFGMELLNNVDENKARELINFLMLCYYEEFYNEENFLVDCIKSYDGEDNISFIREYPNTIYHLLTNFEMISALSISDLVVMKKQVVKDSKQSSSFFRSLMPLYFTDLVVLEMQLLYETSEDFSLEEEEFLNSLNIGSDNLINDSLLLFNSYGNEMKKFLLPSLLNGFYDYTKGKRNFISISKLERKLIRDCEKNENIVEEIMNNEEDMQVVLRGYFNNNKSYYSKELPNHEFETDHLAITKTIIKK